MISGLLLDFSSTSVNTSSTSAADSGKHYIGHPGGACGLNGARRGRSPSTASPRDIFFRYVVMSAALSDTAADMLTRGREPEERSSGEKGRFTPKVAGFNTPHSEITTGRCRLTIPLFWRHLRRRTFHWQSESGQKGLELNQVGVFCTKNPGGHRNEIENDLSV